MNGVVREELPSYSFCVCCARRVAELSPKELKKIYTISTERLVSLKRMTLGKPGPKVCLKTWKRSGILGNSAGLHQCIGYKSGDRK